MRNSGIICAMTNSNLEERPGNIVGRILDERQYAGEDIPHKGRGHPRRETGKFRIGSS